MNAIDQFSPAALKREFLALAAQENAGAVVTMEQQLRAFHGLSTLVCATIIDALGAGQRLWSKKLGDWVEQPDWRARLQAVELFRDTVHGRPAQVSIMLGDSHAAGMSGDKLAKQSPADVERALVSALAKVRGQRAALAKLDRDEPGKGKVGP
jgi:hypothetical protein